MRALYYHSIVERRDPDEYYSANAIEIGEFRSQLREIRGRCDVISSAEIALAYRDGARLPDQAVHISFDDGFADNVAAAEILAASRTPWTLFVIADAILCGSNPWYIQLVRTLRGARNRSVRWRGQTYDFAQLTDKRRFAKAIKRRVMQAPAADHVAVLERALLEAGLPAPGDGRSLFMDVCMLRQVAASGAEIGCHSASHPNLTSCTAAELQREVKESGDRLAAAVNRPIEAFSYPDGRHDAAVRQAVSERYAFAMATESTGPEGGRYAVPRYPPGWTVDSLRVVLAPNYPSDLRRVQFRRALTRPLRAVARTLRLR